MNGSLQILLAALVALVLPAGASADIFECVGPDGARHFTNERPRRGNCRLIVRTPGAPARAARTRPAAVSGTRQFDSSPERLHRYDAYIREAAHLYQLPEPFVRAVVRVESNFTEDVVSHAGAMGLMQLMPGTATAMGVRNPFDPRENIFGGTRYLRVLANQFNGDLVLTVAAYNAGAGAIGRYGGVPPYAETQRYVRNVLLHYYAYRSRQG
jgi:soluble lytic murein transglycosylase-like protein